jgi:RNA polymerase sigma-70 factor (ECF subfamily)
LITEGRGLNFSPLSFYVEFKVATDKELIELVNKGDSDAFVTLYHRYRDWVYRLAWRFTGNEQDALDVLQETFTSLLKKFPGFHLTASMTTFLYPVVKHISLNMRRLKSPGKISQAALEEIAEPVIPQTSRTELAAALANLSDQQQEVVLMRFVEDMTLEEIATVLKVPLNTAKSRLYDALHRLRADPRTKDYFLG